MEAKRTALIIGAGKMGRGFCAEILSSAGCKITFVDSDEQRVARLAAARSYTIYKARKTYFETIVIEGFSALPLSAEGKIIELVLHRGALVMLAVPSAQLESVAKLLAVCIALKATTTPDEPLDILLCVNEMQAKRILVKTLEELLGGTALEYLRKKVGIVETIAICMCPELPDALIEHDVLGVLTNGYNEMPMDAIAFHGVPPTSDRIRLTRDFAAEAHRKMYTFNTAYASIAYLAVASKKNYAWATEAMQDVSIASGVHAALAEATIGLCGEYEFSLGEMHSWNKRILDVIDNPQLGDTISRLSADTPRKVGYEDRLVGAALLCLKHGGMPVNLAHIIACAYRYVRPIDMRSKQFAEYIEIEGIEAALERYSRLAMRNQLHRMVRDIYEKL